MERPDVLVLGAGGTLGEAWMRGLLSGLEAAADLDFRECEYFVGTSAGSIVAATLAAGRRPEAGERAAREWAEAAAAAEEDAGGDDAAADGSAEGSGAAALAGALRERLGAAARGAGRVGVAATTPLAPL